jgi:RNA polymerase sigma-70 factor (ECF subfamily)
MQVSPSPEHYIPEGPLDDSTMITGLRQADPSAREACYKAYRLRLYATACHFLGAQDPDAEDLVHEAFAAAYEGIGRFEGRSSLYTWLNHICVNLCYARIRQRKRQVELSGDDLDRVLGAQAVAAATEAEEAALRAERLERLGAWIRRLGELCRQTLWLRLVEGLPLAQMREKLGVPLGTVAARVARCQAALKEMATVDEGTEGV